MRILNVVMLTIFGVFAIACGTRKGGDDTTDDPNVQWFKAGEEAAVIEGCSLEIIGVHKVTPPERQPYLAVFWMATTGDPSKKFDCSGLRGKMSDDVGNKYDDRLSHGTIEDDHFRQPPSVVKALAELKTKKIGEEYNSGTVASDRAVWGVLHFDLPVPAAKELKLSVPGDAINKKGTFCFVIDLKKYGLP